MTFVSYSQNFEDVLLWRALSTVGTGFYIDIGASHPDTDSVTRAFYDRGWHGINVEPTSAAYLRLTAARPRDINIQVAISNTTGRQPFLTVAGPNAGLSALAQDTQADISDWSTSGMVDVETLAAICERFAPEQIHFLKIDVEGAERVVLHGADFQRFRPWILLIESTAPMSTIETHATWEAIVVESAYRFVWFDGLNRYYVAEEHHATLAPFFRTPPNVFDDFIRAADTEWARRLAEAETRADTNLVRARAAENRATAAQELAELAHLRSLRSATQSVRAEAQLERSETDRARLRSDLEEAGTREIALHRETARLEQARAEMQAWLDAMRRSTTWRVMGPIRRLLRLVGRDQRGQVSAAAVLPVETAIEEPRLPERQDRRSDPVVAVHQFHSGTARGDAITNAMFLTRSILRQRGYRSDIFAQHRAAGLELDVYSIDALPRDDHYVLIVRHSMGHDVLETILAKPVKKILIYHNITPADLLIDTPFQQTYAVKGREQLVELRRKTDVALADSEYNATELRTAGFTDVSSCAILFDLDQLRRSAATRRRSPTFTILFVGRLTHSKGQLELITAFARFRELYRGQTRLILVGRSSDDQYRQDIDDRIRMFGLGLGHVEVTGHVSDAALKDWYACADLYVSLSRHEGFGVPLIEAIAAGVPVLALASAAVPESLNDPQSLLQDERPSEVALRLLAIASEAGTLERLAERQRQHVERFRLEHQIPKLWDALQRVGVFQFPATEAAQALRASMQVTIAGHVNGTYSLAEVNRSLAFALDDDRPGTVRVLPVEGDVLTRAPDSSGTGHKRLHKLIQLPSPLTRPHIVISQHYPVWPPSERGDLCLAYFFWEESLVPTETVKTLNDSFDGVLAPSRVVAKALIDSGVTKPVRLIPHPASLERFRAVRHARRDRPRSGPFTFLHVSSGFPRKGIDLLLAAYAAAFCLDDDVRLIIKCFPNPHNDVEQQIASIRSTGRLAPTIELIDRDLAEDDLLALYEQADVMVLPTRGEGFNLPAAEALEAGLRLIVTGHGGHMDFISAPRARSVRLLSFRLAAARTHLSTPFSLWAEPDEADLVAALRESFAQGRILNDSEPTPPYATADRLSEIALDLLRHVPPQASVAMMTTWGLPCGVAEYARHLVDELPLVQTIFADQRTSPLDADPNVVRCWTVGIESDLPDLAAAIVHANPEAIVIQHQPGLLLWQSLERLLGCDAFIGRVVCVTLHNTRHLLEIDEGIRRSALCALGRMSRVVVHTIQDVNRLLYLGLQNNVVLIPQGLSWDRGRVPPPVRKLERTDPVLIGCYGFFLPGKGIDRLIEVLPLLRQAYPEARLRLVNATYPDPLSVREISYCKNLASSAGLDGIIEFETAFLEEQQSVDLLTACDVVVLPYQYSNEASSAAMRSAMMAQVPVAVTPVPLFDEAEDKVYRLPGLTSQEIAQGLIELLGDQERRHQLVQAADEWRAERLWPLVAKRWDGLLRGLIASAVVVGPEP